MYREVCAALQASNGKCLYQDRISRPKSSVNTLTACFLLRRVLSLHVTTLIIDDWNIPQRKTTSFVLGIFWNNLLSEAFGTVSVWLSVFCNDATKRGYIFSWNSECRYLEQIANVKGFINFCFKMVRVCLEMVSSVIVSIEL